MSSDMGGGGGREGRGTFADDFFQTFVPVTKNSGETVSISSIKISFPLFCSVSDYELCTIC